MFMEIILDDRWLGIILNGYLLLWEYNYVYNIFFLLI